MKLLESGSGVSRRDVLQRAAVGSVLMAAGAILPGCGGSGTDNTSTSTDTNLLNFALNLEYLEAEFYTYATSGSGISGFLIATSGIGTLGATTGGTATIFTDVRTQAIATEIASNERDHVIYLRAALGANAVAKPAINLAALGAFTTQIQFLALARAFEDVGVSAYGAVMRSISDKNLLEAAGRILAAEALHAANIRLLIATQGVATTAVDSNDILPPPTGTLYFPLNAGSLSVIRTTRQVLDVVYGGTGAFGAFFPAGFNGNIKA